MTEQPSESYLNGWMAHKNGVNYSNYNPYNEKNQAISHDQWHSGWVDRFNAIKHGRELKWDNFHIYNME